MKAKPSGTEIFLNEPLNGKVHLLGGSDYQPAVTITRIIKQKRINNMVFNILLGLIQ